MRIGRFLLPLFLLGSIMASAQDGIRYDTYPHLFVIPYLSLNGGGFQPASLALQGGLTYEGHYVSAAAQAGYNWARKDNDGTVDNVKGQVRSLSGELLVRLPNYWMAGAHGGWSQLSTTNYTKQGYGLALGGGKDVFLSDISFRVVGMYSVPWWDSINGEQGPSLRFILPSPLIPRHFYFYEQVGAVFLHDTVTDPSDPAMTEHQLHNRHHTAGGMLGVLIKF